MRVRILKVPGFELSLRDMKHTNKLGRLEEPQIGVPDFDDQFLIRTNDEARCVSYLSNGENRDCIKRIYGQGWRAEFGKKWIELTKTLGTKGITFHPITAIQDQEIEGLVKEAALLGKGL